MLQITSNLYYFKNIYLHLSESRFLSEAKGSYLDEYGDESDEIEAEEVSESDKQIDNEDNEELDYDEEEF